MRFRAYYYYYELDMYNGYGLPAINRVLWTNESIILFVKIKFVRSMTKTLDVRMVLWDGGKLLIGLLAVAWQEYT